MRVAECILLPNWEIASYLETKIKKHNWKQLPVEIPADLPADPADRAYALFNLVEPRRSATKSSWEAYNTYRAQAEEQMQGLYDMYEGEEVPPYLGAMTEQFMVILQDDEEEDEANEDKDTLLKIQDGICVTMFDIEDAWDEVRTSIGLRSAS